MCAESAEESRSGGEKQALRLLSRSARLWKSQHRSDGKAVPIHFDRDFSKLTTAADLTDAWLRLGKAVAVIPDRSGVSGTYFISDSSGNPVAVFKPIDEEAGQDANPLQVDLFDGCFHAFVLGECAYKEAAAYLLDHKMATGIPQTTIVTCVTPLETSNGLAANKTGAFQVFQDNIGDADDFGPALFPTENIQRIAAFDLRVLNSDRHGGNLLVVKNETEHRLVPIDHGYILPDRVVSPTWPVWMQWPQSKQPLSSSLTQCILDLDCDNEVHTLEEELGHSISAGSIRSLRIATAFLKKGVSLGMSMYAIGLLVFSSGSSTKKSLLEKIADEALRAGLMREQRIESQLDLLSLDDSTERRWLRPSTEDFIVKYASKLMENRLCTIAGFGSLTRARSNPNFFPQTECASKRKQKVAAAGDALARTGSESTCARQPSRWTTPLRRSDMSVPSRLAVSKPPNGNVTSNLD
mmetsp:Transcript_2037/g.6101  ORF Transcript_2037/g.6101 Transcript_2037/m.6101 type:complete len:467 (+) Transcript_2037:171-1571(+)